MNLLWQDDFGSFFDPSAADGNGGAISFASPPGWGTSPPTWATGLPSGQSLLWTGNSPAPSAASDVNTAHLAGFDAGTAGLFSTGNGLTGQDVLWADSGSSATTWQLADNAGDTGAMGLATPSLPLGAGSLPSDAGSLVWQTMLSRFEDAVANSSTLDATLNQILDVLWTATGGTGSPSVTSLHAPTNPFVDGLPTDPSQLVWTGEPPLHLTFPDGTGQPPLAPPVSGGPPEPTFGTLAPQHLVWTDPSQGVAASLADQPNVGASLPPTLFSRA